MKIVIEIPSEFETHFEQDRFEDSLHRLSADAHLLAGNYEQEVLTMLIKAFKDCSVIEVNEDAISRGGLMTDLQGIWDAYTPNNMIDFQDMLEDIDYKIRNAPSVVPTEKMGKWIKVPGYATPGGDPVWECSECGKGRHVYGIEASSYQRDVSNQQWVACPNCGVRMKG